MWLLLVMHGHEVRCLARHLQRLGDDGGNDLPTIGHRIGLQDPQILADRGKPKRERVIKRREPWGVLVRENGDDARKSLRGARVDRGDPAPGNRALHREDVRDVVNRVFIGIFGRTGDLLSPVETAQRCADGARDELHLHGCTSSSVRSSSVRTRVLRASGTLNALPGRGCASANSASAARLNISSVAGAPRSTASAFVARQGLGATPPSAMRTSRTTPSVTSSAAATETSAKA